MCVRVSLDRGVMYQKSMMNGMQTTELGIHYEQKQTPCHSNCNVYYHFRSYFSHRENNGGCQWVHMGDA